MITGKKYVFRKHTVRCLRIAKELFKDILNILPTENLYCVRHMTFQTFNVFFYSDSYDRKCFGLFGI